MLSCVSVPLLRTVFEKLKQHLTRFRSLFFFSLKLHGE